MLIYGVRISHKFLVVAMSTILLSACTTDGGVDPMVNSATESSANPAVSGAKGAKPTISAPAGNPPATLTKTDIFEGDGKEAVATSTLEVHYTLMAWSTGVLVESSWDSGQTATFPLSGVIASNPSIASVVSFSGGMANGLDMKPRNIRLERVGI